MVVVNRDTSRLSVLTMKARRKMISKEKGKEKPRKHTQLGMTMRYPPPALQKMQKQTYA